jgi:hypothetical protein
MSPTRTKAACLKAADEAAMRVKWGAAWDAPFSDDSDGNQRWRAADEAASHLASMAPDRRAQLEREWRG